MNILRRFCSQIPDVVTIFLVLIASATAAERLTPHGNTDAHKAVLGHNAEQLQNLIHANSPTISAFNQSGEMPLHLAARIGAIHCLDIFLANFSEDQVFTPAGDSDQNSQAAHEHNPAAFIAAAQNDSTNLAKFIERFPDRTLTTHNAHGNFCLHIAAREGSLHTLLMLIQAAKEYSSKTKTPLPDIINAQNTNRLTALHLACREGHARIVIALLASGANPALTSSGGKTALDMAQNNLRRIRGTQEHTAAQYRSIIRLLKRAQHEEIDAEFDEAPAQVGADSAPDPDSISTRIVPLTPSGMAARKRETTPLHTGPPEKN